MSEFLLKKKKKFLLNRKYNLFFKLGFYLNGSSRKNQQNFLSRKNIFYNYYVKSKIFFIKVLTTKRNAFIGLFNKKGNIQFILSMGLIRNQNNLRRKSYYACKLLFRSILVRKLNKKKFLTTNHKFILIFLGFGKFYKIFHNILDSQRLTFLGLIQKNNLAHNGCFKKNKRRK